MGREGVVLRVWVQVSASVRDRYRVRGFGRAMFRDD